MPGKVVLVAGGTSGVGRKLVELLAGRGERIVVTGTRPDRLQALLSGAGGAIHGVLADIADPVAMESAVASGLDAFGHLDALIVTAGRGSAGDLLEGSPDQWRAMVLTNVLGPALAVRAVLPHIADTRGQIILLGSVFGRIAAPANLYSPTKWAVSAYAESLRQQMTGSGVRVCVVQPGRIDTPWWPDGAPPPALQPDDVARCVVWVLDQPTDVDVNEIVLRPVGQTL